MSNRDYLADELVSSLKEVTRILDAVRSTNQLGRTQLERLERAKQLIAEAEGRK